MRSRAVTVTAPLLCQCFCLVLDAKRPHTGSPHCCQAAGDSSSQCKAKGDWLWKSLWNGRGGGGVLCLKNTLNFRLRCSVCADQTSLSAGVRQVTCWRWDDAMRSHTLISHTMNRIKHGKHNLKCAASWRRWTHRSYARKVNADVKGSAPSDHLVHASAPDPVYVQSGSMKTGSTAHRTCSPKTDPEALRPHCRLQSDQIGGVASTHRRAAITCLHWF